MQVIFPYNRNGTSITFLGWSFNVCPKCSISNRHVISMAVSNTSSLHVITLFYFYVKHFELLLYETVLYKSHLNRSELNCCRLRCLCIESCPVFILLSVDWSDVGVLRKLFMLKFKRALVGVDWYWLTFLRSDDDDCSLPFGHVCHGAAICTLAATQ